MQNSDNLKLEAPSLPKGGGALTGLSGQMGAAGPDGAASLSVPLPISAGRGYAPALALSYSSQAGNGPFGIGWSVSLPAVGRRTRMGVPDYTPTDEFIAPDGEVLAAVLDDNGNPLSSQRSTLLGTALGGNYQVLTYRSRVERDFSRLEYWRSAARDFWLWYSTDGQIHLLGYEDQARISAPTDATQTAQWLLNASLSASGEQIYYRYRAEDDTGCSAAEISAHPDANAQRYISEVHYGNIQPGRSFPCLNGADALIAGWLFVLVFDYGERPTAAAQQPPFKAGGVWPCRQDCFTGYQYGFALRSRRLCRQVLMFHRLATLAGKANGSDTPALVSRLLLSYHESPFVTTLSAVESMAFAEGKPQTLPPLEFGWQSFTLPEKADWHSIEMGNFNPQQPYQYLDLLGEGLAGLLYQDRGAWWYRAPIRDTQSADAIGWESPRPLPGIPALQDGAVLADLNGDGRLQWVVTAAGVNGHYDQQQENPGQWLHFTPLAALPQEYAHPRAHLIDINGAGFADLVLIGPRSVRLYAGNGSSWQQGQTIPVPPGVMLPIPDDNAQRLVAFSDPLGSGQQHLVQVCADGVTCWPNLGHGRFGQPLTLNGFSADAVSFNPERLLLADLDGSGAVDIIYAHSDHLEIYRNRSGNGFEPPFNINLPADAHYDHTSQLQAADVQGLGVASLLLTVPHPVPRHYLLHLAADKPWLLKETNNNMGARQRLHYRSSAQFWLDEKAEAAVQDKPQPACYLPFPLHLLWRSESLDEISGNRLESEVRYRHGVWDGREREFRGFGRLEVQDSTEKNDISTPPALTRSWYYTGVATLDKQMEQEYWSGDSGAFSLFSPLYTTGAGDSEVDCPPEVVQKQAFWLGRSLKGLLLRSEIYGLDGSERQAVPYSVTEQRPYARLIADTDELPVIYPGAVETRSYHYERVAEDPQCSQQIVLSTDEYGQTLREVTVNYPRRLQSAHSPYPDNLPETLFASSFDPQQQTLRLTLSQYRWHQLTTLAQGQWITGLTDANRSDVFAYTADQLPSGGLSLETLSSDDSLIAVSRPRLLAAQQQNYWLDSINQPGTGTPAFPPRLAWSDSALLDHEMLQQLGDRLDFTHELSQAGYHQANYLFTRASEQNQKLWIVRSGSSEYGDAAQFWRPKSYRASPLTGSNTLSWDANCCVVTAHRDAAGLSVSAEYDWRFLIPVRITDVNANIHSITLDALGRLTSSRFSGSENGVTAGYSDVDFPPPNEVDSALKLTAPLPVAQCYVYVSDSWMKTGAEKLPPHLLTLTTDRYDNDPEQQIRQQVSFSDGFGRMLQTAVRFEAGSAWQRDADGALKADANGQPLAADSDFRWAVSGRSEYDTKGQLLRSYQPYFLNDWRYVSDDSARQDLYADSHYYDPLGREYQVITAKGYLRRALVTPWFVVSEDENNTLDEVTSS